MKKIINAAAVLSIFCFSCQKEYNPLVSEPNITATDSNYLSTIHTVDMAGNDTLYVLKFFYDTQKRCNKIIDSTSPAEYTIGKFDYLGSDTLPYKTSIYFYDITNDTATIFHFYNTAGKKIKDSALVETSTEISLYHYFPGMITGTFASDNFTIPACVDTAYLDSRGNVTLLKEYRDGELHFSLESTYDDKPDPFSKLSIYASRNIFPFANDPSEFSEFYYQKNNFTQHLVKYYSGSTVVNTETRNFQYQYNSRGYIIERFEPGLGEKLFYRYAVL